MPPITYYYQMKDFKIVTSFLLSLGFAFNSAALYAQKSSSHVLSKLDRDSTNVSQEFGLEEVVVTGTRTEKTLANTPVLTRVVSAAQIRQNDYENIVDALESSIPGLSFKQDGRGTNIKVQGLENKYILLLIDGERISNTPAGNIDFERLNLSNVKQIEVVKGASSVLYGSNAIGMIINIITQTPTREIEGWAKVRYGSFNDLSTDLGLGLSHKGLSSLTTLYRKSDDGYNLNPEDQQSFTKNPHRNYTLQEKIAWEGKKTSIKALGTFYFGEEFNPPKSIKNTHYKSNNQSYGASIEHKLGEQHRMKLSYSGDFYKRMTVKEKENEVFKNASSSIQTIRLIDRYSINEQAELIAGSEFNWNKDYSEMQFGAEDQHRSVNDINVFAQADCQLFPALNLIAGARYTKHSSFGNALTPKMNLMYSFKQWRFRAGYSRGFKAPSPTELYSDFMMGSVSHNIGNPNLKAEKSNYAYCSAQYKHNYFHGSAEIYFNSVHNKIQSFFVHVVNIDGTSHTELRYDNVDDVRIRGLQIMTDIFPMSSLSIHAGYVYTDARDLKTGLQLWGNSLHALNWNVTYKNQIFKRNASISLGGRWNSEQINEKEVNTLNPETGETETTITHNPQDAYALWRLTAQVTPWEHKQMKLTLTLGIQNIFNYTDPIHYTTFDPGRRIFGSLMLRF